MIGWKGFVMVNTTEYELSRNIQEVLKKHGEAFLLGYAFRSVMDRDNRSLIVDMYELQELKKLGGTASPVGGVHIQAVAPDTSEGTPEVNVWANDAQHLRVLSGIATFALLDLSYIQGADFEGM